MAVSTAHMKHFGAANCTQPAAIGVFKFPRESKAIIFRPPVPFGKAPKANDRSTGLDVTAPAGAEGLWGLKQRATYATTCTQPTAV